MNESLPSIIWAAGLGQLTVLIASALVPFRLNWKLELQTLSRLHRQMYWVYGGYIVFSILSFSLISICHSVELASGTGLARSFCLYVALFWGVRLPLQAFFDVKEHLSTWWLRLGYQGLTILFMTLTCIYAWAALQISD